MDLQRGVINEKKYYVIENNYVLFVNWIFMANYNWMQIYVA